MGSTPDTIRVAVLRMDFMHDRGGSASTGTGRFDLGAPDPLAPLIDPPPHNRPFYLSHLEALRRYTAAQSYGGVVVTGDVWPRLRNSAYSVTDMADFGPWDFGPGLYDAAVHMFRSMLFAADSQSIALYADRIPWDQYDRFVIVHAGSDHQSDVLDNSPEDIPTFTLGVAGDDVVIFPDTANRPIDRASFIPETRSQDGFLGAINGVMAHEGGHNFFGFLDAYDVNTGISVVGYWSLMDSGHLVGAIVDSPAGPAYVTGLLPPSVDPFHRQFMSPDIVAPEVTLGDTVDLLSIERHNSLHKVSIATDEYLLLEDRYLAPTVSLDVDDSTHVVLGPDQPDRFEYDALLPGGGALIWQVDEGVILRDGSINADPSRRGLRVIEADGLKDLGDPASPYFLGAPTDPWYVGNHTLLDSQTVPPLLTHTGADPGLGLSVLDAADSSMRVLVAPTPRVTVLFPNGGEVLLAGGDVKLTWAATDALGIPSVKLEISRNNGGTWEAITASAPNTGSYVWRVSRPATQSNTARFRVTAVDVAGFHGIDVSNTGFSIYAPPTSVDAADRGFALTQIRPNPAASLPVRIEYSVAWETKVRISIVDVQGRVVRELANAVMPAGQHEVVWTHGTATPAGLYFVILEAAGQSYRRRLVIVG